MRHKILLIDDDRDDQVNFCRCIYEIDTSIECLLAGNGGEALLHLKAVTQRPGLIFLDLNMPLMDGYEYLSEIRAQRIYDDIPVVIFTTSNDSADMEKARMYGIAGYLVKPASMEELKRELEAILRKFFKPHTT
jgi:CheY-like chemotaxis protein